MFKKLKQKINEEQSPQRNAQSPQAQVGPGGDRRGSHTPSLPRDGPVLPSDREVDSPASGVGLRSPRGSINGDGGASPQRAEPQSLAQKLLKVPSVESLLRSAGRAEGLFRSASRESLPPLGEAEPPAYDPPSDLESEVEEGEGGEVSKEHQSHRLARLEKSLGKYRVKYSELVTAYRSVQKDKEKTQVILSQSQDKALRRIGELREELQMDQQAKKHLQDEFDSVLEEKDQMITVLQTQVALMKKRLKGAAGGAMTQDSELSLGQETADPTSPQSPSRDPAADSGASDGGDGGPGQTLQALQKRVKRQENILQRCKEVLRTHQERSAQLGSENEALQQQLQERLQELEKTKELHTTEKTKLITQLRDAKNLIEQLEQDKGMVIAETKRQMHETLEMKEEEIAALRSRVQQATAQRDLLQEHREHSERAAFEELERALSMAQRAEEGRRQLEEQVKDVERTGEEERRNLQQELSRVKQEVVTIMMKSSEEKVCELEKQHKEALEHKEQEALARISQAVEQCEQVFEQASKERVQQAGLELEEMQLQRAALEAAALSRAQEAELELEAARTRILELESCQAQSEPAADQASQLGQEHRPGLEAGQQEALERRLQEEEARHRKELEEVRLQHQESLGGVEKTLKEELNKLKTALQKKEEELEEHLQRESRLVEEAEATLQERDTNARDLEETRQRLVAARTAEEELQRSNTQLGQLTDELRRCHSKLEDLERHMEAAQRDCLQKEEALQLKVTELQETELQLQQSRKELSEQDERLCEKQRAGQEQQERLKKQLEDQKASHEKKIENIRKDIEGKLKAQETKMEKFKQKAKEMQDKFKKKLQESEEALKEKDAVLQQKQEQEQEAQARFLLKKSQELEEASRQVGRSMEVQEQAQQEVRDLREELAIRETTVQKLQAELREAASQREALADRERRLKQQLEAMERNLSQTLSQKNHTQDQLSRTGEESKAKLQTLSHRCEDAERKLQALEASRSQEDDLQRTLEEEFQTRSAAVSQQLEQVCLEIHTRMEGAAGQLCERVEARVGELQDRVFRSQKRVAHLKNVLLTKVDRIRTLEEGIRQRTEENQKLCSSVEQLTSQLQAHTERIQALTKEKVSLLADAEKHSQALSKKAFRVQQLSQENTAISEKVESSTLHISNLEGMVQDLKTQLVGKEEERQQELQELLRQMDKLHQDKMATTEQAEALKENLSEFKVKAEAKLTQSHDTVQALQARLEGMERQLAERDEDLRRLEQASGDCQSISKSEMDQALSEKEQKMSALGAELELCSVTLSEREEQLAARTRECEQLTADLRQRRSLWEAERKERSGQLQLSQDQSSQCAQEAKEKLQALEMEKVRLRQELEGQKEDFEKKEEEVLRSQEERLTAEGAGKMSELKKKAEQKIVQIRKQLNSQLEEKDRSVRSLQAQLEEVKKEVKEQEQNNNNLLAQLEEVKEQSLKTLQAQLEEEKEHSLKTLQAQLEEEKEQSLKTLQAQLEEEKEQSLRTLQAQLEEEKEQSLRTLQAQLKEEKMTRQKALEERRRELQGSMSELREEQEKRLEQIRSEERLERDSCLQRLKDMYEDKLASLQKEDKKEENQPDKTAAMQEEIRQKLREAEEQNSLLQAELSRLGGDLEERSRAARAPRREEEKQCLLEDGPGGSLQSQLAEATAEMQKVQREFLRLQEDMRALRREHQQELELVRKELGEENDRKLQLEVEEVEARHSSSLKQLMREFNTQLAVKERDLDAAVKEAIGRAQGVEAELMAGHREEVSQLHKQISQKEDEMQKTVQRYEEVLQSREQEMGDRVWQVQKEMEDLHTRMQDSPQDGMEELQAQLAQKTTLLSEARLKEQGLVDRIHLLEDKMRCVHKNSVVTHLTSSYKGLHGNDGLSEPTEFDYLRKVLFEYMMGRETKTMAKVITTMLKFPPDQAQKLLENEDSKTTVRSLLDSTAYYPYFSYHYCLYDKLSIINMMISIIVLSLLLI
ncbi:golgin subfamily A member 4 isoform X2 [Osmerus mordax]|uniref:golgin subfamily A member 4 isoform X2 n=1 Tax=Osmerus mordax TaxID=8014 RepID=UPI00350F3E25